MRWKQGLAAALAGVAALALALPGGASAQAAPGTQLAQALDPADIDPELRDAYAAAFRATSADPGNLDKAFEFAGIAIRAGDYEGAIATLERMLLLDPQLPRVRLELGALYYRLGSYETARHYFDSALQAPNVPAEVRERVMTFRAEIDRRQAPSQFSGSITAGLRYQSNANTAPTGGNVRVGGLPARLDEEATAEGDVNAFLFGTLRHAYDFGTQDRTMWESFGNFYVARQFDRTDVDVTYLQATTGPRFFADALLYGLSVRPFVAADFVMIHDKTDYVAPGGGVSLDYNEPGASVSLLGEWRHRFFNNTRERPQNDNRSGDELGLRLSADKTFASFLTLFAALGYVHFDARRGFESYDEIGVTAGAQAAFTGPFGAEGIPWTLTFSATRLFTDYDRPDATIDPDTKRRDRDWRLNATLTAPLSADWSAMVSFGRNQRDSSLPNYDYTNYFGLVGATWRF